MNKILKILSILVIGFVMFSCSTPTNNPVEETPEVKTYSIIFKAADESSQFVVDYLKTLSEFKNLEEGTTKMLYKQLYADNAANVTKEIIIGTSMKRLFISYNNSEIDSVFIGNKNVEVEVTFESSEDI